MNTKSLRFRLTFWYLIILLVSSVVIFTSFYYVTQQTLKNQTDREISIHAQAIINLISNQTPSSRISLPREQITQEFAQMPGMLIAVSDNQGKQITTSQPIDQGLQVLSDVLEKSVDSKSSIFIDQQINNISMRMGIFPIYKDSLITNLVLVAHPTDVIYRSLNNLVEILIISIFIIGFLASTVTYFVAKSALVPLTKLSAHLQAVSTTNLNQPLPVPQTGDEIENLSTTFNSLLFRLAESFSRERQFIGDVAHELKTPLSTIKSGIEVTLSKKRSYLELKNTLAENLTDIDRLSSTINDVLDLAWSESGEIESQFINVDLSKLTKEIVELLKNFSNPKNILIFTEIADGIFVSGVPKKLFRAIYNLIDNAVKFTPISGKISLTLTKHQYEAILEISNTGPGIIQRDQVKIFNRFYRGQNTKITGSGLGLSICKSIIEAHHGTINVVSIPNKITTFSITLPVIFTKS